MRFDQDAEIDAAIRSAMMQAPILLSANTNALSRGGKASVTDTTKIQNPFNGPMLLDEIRVRVQVANPATWNAYGRINIDLRLGDMFLTHGDVPVALLGRKLNPGNSGSVASFAWRLHHPLWVPPGGYVQPIFRFDDVGYTNGEFDYSSSAHTMYVTYVGRPLHKGAPRPSMLKIPWVAAWRNTPLNGNAGAGSYSTESTEADLVNPFNVPVHVHRLAGQVQVDGNDASQSSYWGNGHLNGSYSVCTLRMLDNVGRIIIRDPTIFANIFKPADDSWTVNAELPPHGFIKVLADFSQQTLGSGSDLVAQIAMIGTREVR